MADGNIDPDLINTLSNMRDALSDFTDRVSRSYDPVLDSQRRTLQADKDYQNRQKEIREKQLEGTRVFINSTLGFAKELTNSAGSFKPLTTAIDLASKVVGNLVEKIPLIGGLLKGVAEGVADAAKFIVDQFDQTYKLFEELSGTGVIAKFDSFVGAVDRTGLSFSDLNSILSKNSKELSMLSGTTLRGTTAFVDVAEATRQYQEEMQRLGISTSEYREMQLFYMEQEKRSGRNKSNAELVKGSNELVLELDKMTKLFGVSRKEQMEQRKALQLDIQYRAAAAKLGPGFEDAVNTVQTALKSIPGGEKLFEPLKGIMAGLVPITKEQQMLTTVLGEIGINAIDLSEKLRTEGKEGGLELANMLARNGNKITKMLQDLAAVRPDLPLVQLFTVFKDLAARGEITTKMLDDVTATQGDARREQKDLNSDLAKTRVSMYQTSTMLQSLAVSSNIATSAMGLLASGINALVEKLYVWAGKPIPPAVKIQSALYERTQELAKIEKAMIDKAQPIQREIRGPAGNIIQKDPKIIEQEQKQLDESIAQDKKQADIIKQQIQNLLRQQQDLATRKPGESSKSTPLVTQQESDNKNKIDSLQEQIKKLTDQSEFIIKYEQSKEKSAKGALVQGPYAINAENEERYTKLKIDQQKNDTELKRLQSELGTLTSTTQSALGDTKISSAVQAERERDRITILQRELETARSNLAEMQKEYTTEKSEAVKREQQSRIERTKSDIESLIKQIRRTGGTVNTAPGTIATPQQSAPQKVSQVELDTNNIQTLVAAFRENMQQGSTNTTDKLAALEQTMSGIGRTLENIHEQVSKTNQIYARISSYTLA